MYLSVKKYPEVSENTYINALKLWMQLLFSYRLVIGKIGESSTEVKISKYQGISGNSIGMSYNGENYQGEEGIYMIFTSHLP